MKFPVKAFPTITENRKYISIDPWGTPLLNHMGFKWLSGFLDPMKQILCLCQHTMTDLLQPTTLSLFPSLVRKDIPPSAVTRPICGIMGTIRLVAGKSSCHKISKIPEQISCNIMDNINLLPNTITLSCTLEPFCSTPDLNSCFLLKCFKN